MAVLIYILMLSNLLLMLSNGLVEYAKEDHSCVHKSEIRYNQNPPVENEFLREVNSCHYEAVQLLYQSLSRHLLGLKKL